MALVIAFGIGGYAGMVLMGWLAGLAMRPYASLWMEPEERDAAGD